MNSVLVSFFGLCFEINASMISKKYLLAVLIVFWKASLIFKSFLHFIAPYLSFR